MITSLFFAMIIYTLQRQNLKTNSFEKFPFDAAKNILLRNSNFATFYIHCSAKNLKLIGLKKFRLMPPKTLFVNFMFLAASNGI